MFMYETQLYETQFRSTAVLLWVSAVMQAGARCVCATARRLDAWLEKRRAARADMRDFATMSERDLRDIGLTRIDMHRAARSAAIEIEMRI